MPSQSSIETALLPKIAAVCVVALLFGLTAWIGIKLTYHEDRIAALWFPNAILVAVLMRNYARGDAAYIAGCFVANIAVNLLTGDSAGRATGLAFVNSVEAILVCVAIRRWCGLHLNLTSFRHLGIFMVVGGFAAPAASALLATVFLGSGFSALSAASWLRWTLSDGLGLLIGSPVVMAVIDAWRQRRGFSVHVAAEIATLAIVGAAATTLIFAQSVYPLLFLGMPLVMISAFRLGSVGVALSVTIIALVASIATAYGIGPLSLLHVGVTQKLLALQLFLAACLATGLPVAAVLATRARISHELEESRSFVAAMLENMREVVFRADPGGRWVFLNPAWQELTGFAVAESLGEPITRHLHADDVFEVNQFCARMASGELTEGLLDQQFLTAAGEHRRVEISVRRLVGKDGGFAGTIGNIRDVTDRRIAEAELRASEALFRYLTEAAPVGIYRADANGKVTYVDEVWCAQLGMTGAEALGDGWLKAVADTTTYDVDPLWVGFTKPGERREREIRFRKPDGSDLWAQSLVSAEFDANGTLTGFVGVLIDITERKRAAVALLESERRFSMLINGIRDHAVYMLDPDGRVTDWNAGAATLNGYSSSEIIGQHFSSFYTDEGRSAGDPARALSIARQNDNFAEDGWRVRKDGSHFWASVSIEPIFDDAATLVGYANITRDITDRREAAHRIAKLQTDLVNSSKQSGMDSMGAMLAHELNQPLTAIALTTQAAIRFLSNPTPERIVEAQSALNEVKQGALRAGGLIRALRDMVSRGRVRDQPEDLSAIVADVLALLAARLQENDVTCRHAVPTSLMVYADRIQLEQVLLNLLNNAIDAVAGRPVRAIEIDASVDMDFAVVSISDTGIGIPDEEAAHVFDLMFTTKSHGIGIGLGICRAILEAHGGSIWYDASHGSGATFRFKLPIQAR